MRDRRGPWRARGRLRSILLALAVALAPLWIALAHGPVAFLAASEPAAEASAHAHLHAREADRPGHDPADHDHQAEATAQGAASASGLPMEA